MESYLGKLTVRETPLTAIKPPKLFVTPSVDKSIEDNFFPLDNLKLLPSTWHSKFTDVLILRSRESVIPRFFAMRAKPHSFHHSSIEQRKK